MRRTMILSVTVGQRSHFCVRYLLKLPVVEAFHRDIRSG